MFRNIVSNCIQMLLWLYLLIHFITIEAQADFINPIPKDISQDSLEKIIQTCTHNINEGNKKFDNLVMRGLAYGQSKMPKLAMADLSQAIELNPTSYFAYHNRGNLKISSGEIDSALQDYEQAIKLEPNCALCLYGKSIVLYEKEDFQNAIKFCSKALDINENYIPALMIRGASFDALRQYNNAIEDFDRVLSIDYRYLGAITGKGLVYIKMNKFEKALKEFHLVNSHDSTYNRFLLLDIGYAYSQLNKHLESIEWYSKFIDHDKNNPNAYYGRGVGYIQTQKIYLGCKDFELAAGMGHEEARKQFNNYCK